MAPIVVATSVRSGRASSPPPRKAALTGNENVAANSAAIDNLEDLTKATNPEAPGTAQQHGPTEATRASHHLAPTGRVVLAAVAVLFAFLVATVMLNQGAVPFVRTFGGLWLSKIVEAAASKPHVACAAMLALPPIGAACLLRRKLFALLQTGKLAVLPRFCKKRVA